MVEVGGFVVGLSWACSLSHFIFRYLCLAGHYTSIFDVKEPRAVGAVTPKADGTINLVNQWSGQPARDSDCRIG